MHRILFSCVGWCSSEVCFLKYPSAKGHKAPANLTIAFNIVFMNSEGKV